MPGPAALGGVAVGGIFFNSVFWTFGFLRMSTTGLVAQAYGARDHQSLRLHFARALLTAAAIGVLLLAVKEPLIAIVLEPGVEWLPTPPVSGKAKAAVA